MNQIYDIKTVLISRNEGGKIVPEDDPRIQKFLEDGWEPFSTLNIFESMDYHIVSYYLLLRKLRPNSVVASGSIEL